MSTKQKTETSEPWTPFGKPWGTVEQFNNFEEADKKRNFLLTQWGKDTNMRVKVRRSSEGVFRVKIRDEEPPNKSKKRKKKKEVNND
jgi:hypothetical protein